MDGGELKEVRKILDKRIVRQPKKRRRMLLGSLDLSVVWLKAL